MQKVCIILLENLPVSAKISIFEADVLVKSHNLIYQEL